jgi:hypothetical protein
MKLQLNFSFKKIAMEDFNFVLFISNDILTSNPKDVIFTKKYFKQILPIHIVIKNDKILKPI